MLKWFKSKNKKQEDVYIEILDDKKIDRLFHVSINKNNKDYSYHRSLRFSNCLVDILYQLSLDKRLFNNNVFISYKNDMLIPLILGRKIKFHKAPDLNDKVQLLYKNIDTNKIHFIISEEDMPEIEEIFVPNEDSPEPEDDD